MRRRRGNPLKSLIIFLVVFAIFIGISAVVGVTLVNRYFPLRYANIVKQHADENNLDPSLVFAVIHAESRFNASAVSNVGASGLMQIMEGTAYWIAPRIGLDNFNYDADIFTPEINIQMGTYYLAMHLQNFGSIELALAAYNAGRGNVSNWLSNPDISSDGITLDRVPFLETENYIQRVDRNQRIYEIILRLDDMFGVFQ